MDAALPNPASVASCCTASVRLEDELPAPANDASCWTFNVRGVDTALPVKLALRERDLYASDAPSESRKVPATPSGDGTGLATDRAIAALPAPVSVESWFTDAIISGVATLPRPPRVPSCWMLSVSGPVIMFPLRLASRLGNLKATVVSSSLMNDGTPILAGSWLTADSGDATLPRPVRVASVCTANDSWVPTPLPAMLPSVDSPVNATTVPPEFVVSSVLVSAPCAIESAGVDPPVELIGAVPDTEVTGPVPLAAAVSRPCASTVNPGRSCSCRL